QRLLIGLGGSVAAAEGRHFDDLGAEAYMHDLEPAADDAAAAKQLADLFGAGVRGDVEILRALAEQQVAHAAADQEALVAGCAQARHHLEGALADVLAGN